MWEQKQHGGGTAVWAVPLDQKGQTLFDVEEARAGSYEFWEKKNGLLVI